MKDMSNEISEIDLRHYKMIRENVSRFLKTCAEKYDTNGYLLDIAPQDHEGAKAYFSKMAVETLDINPISEATYIADLCQDNADTIEGNRFDIVVCTEVLEHTLNPFAAVGEIKRILRKGGKVFFSAPFNFRIHGPLPDCWRFSEHGWRALLADGWKIIEIKSLESDRFLAPVHYTVIAEKIV